MFKDAIWVRLRAQLGNQMFQHCAGLAAAKVCRAGGVRHFGERNLLAGAFGIGSSGLRLNMAGKMARWGLSLGWLRDNPLGDWQELAPHVWSERTFDWDKAKPGDVLQGWYQSANLVRSLEGDLNGIFKPLPVHAAAADRFWKSSGLDREQTCAVHVRLGDYGTSDMGLAHPQTGWIMPADYYRAALLRVKPGTRFAIFSDEPDRAAQMLAGILPDPVVVKGNHSVTDMAIMSQCRQMVGSNSTFAWWAATLGVAKETVVFPEFFLGWYRKVWFPAEIRAEGWEWVSVYGEEVP